MSEETFIFFREDGWYPVNIPREAVQDNIDSNPGTIRVEDADGNIIWELKKH